MNFPSRVVANSMYLIMCRCCGKDGSRSSDYYDDSDFGFEKKELCKNILKDVFNIQLQSLKEQYFICKECISRLRDASLFKEMVIRNEAIFVHCIQTELEKEKNPSSSDLKMEEIKEEVSPETVDLVMQHDCHQDTFEDDDDEILANLRNEDHKRIKSENSIKQVNATKKSKFKRCKKVQHIETDEIEKVRTENRGSGPLLRENSIKLLANSTATIFQWNKSRYRCFCCKEPYSDTDLLRTHTTTHTLQEIQKNIIHQQNRLVKVEITKLNCKLCQKQLKNLDNLKEHLLEHDIVVNDHLLVPFKIETPLKCQICSEQFPLFRLLNIHMNKHYQKHVCDICGAGFSNLVFFNLHRTRSHRLIRCQKCDIIFFKRTEKKQHDTDVHGVKQERKYRFPCPFCNERYSQESLKIKHLVEKHAMKKPDFCCQFCSKSFLTRSLVNNHVKLVHMKEKSYECDLCHNFFYTRSDLARHKVSHTGEKRYACSLCNNPFASKDSMRRHMKKTHMVH